MVRSRLRIAVLCVAFGWAGEVTATPASALAEAAAVTKQVRKALDGGDFGRAATLTFDNVDKLRREAGLSLTSEGDRQTLQRAACVALRALARLDERPQEFSAEKSTRDRLQADCESKPAPPAESPPAAPPVDPKPETPQPKPAEQQKPVPPPTSAIATPPPPARVDTRPKSTALRTAAITTGVLSGAVLIGSAVMLSVVARPANEPGCSDRGCLAGSYGKAYTAALASWTDADPNNNVPHGAGDQICSDTSRASNHAVADACHQRDALKVSTIASLVVGAALGTTAVVTGVLYARKAAVEKPKAAFSVQPIVGRNWMLSATLRF